MKLKVIMVLLAISFGLSACKKDFTKPEHSQNKSEKTAEAYRLNNWMGDIFAERQDEKLSEIVMPGAHDAATYKITTGSDWARDASWFKKLGGKRPAFFWSFTTRNNIYGLLNIGVRNFDLRIEHNDKGYYSYHGLISTNAEEIIGDLKRYFDEHPKEIAHLELRADQMSDSEYETLLRMIVDGVGKDRVLASTDNIRPNDPIGKYWENGKNLLISCGRTSSDSEYDKYALRGFMYSTWANSSWASRVEEYMWVNIRTRPMDQLYASSMTQTPDSDVIAHGIISTPKSLEDLCTYGSKWGAINTEVNMWLPHLGKEASLQGKKVNIVTVDFPEFNNITRTIIDYNFVQMK
ncbi:MAG: hypothetical protein ACEPOV_14380 [Hyphomicrobiales bacterium]